MSKNQKSFEFKLTGWPAILLGLIFLVPIAVVTYAVWGIAYLLLKLLDHYGV